MYLDHGRVFMLYNSKFQHVVASYTTQEEAERHFNACDNDHKEQLKILNIRMTLLLGLFEDWMLEDWMSRNRNKGQEGT